MAVLWALKLTAAVAAVAALGLASLKIAELGHALAGSTYDAYLAWLARALEAPMKILAPVFRADEGSPRYIWLRAIIPLNVALLIWAVPNPAPQDAK